MRTKAEIQADLTTAETQLNYLSADISPLAVDAMNTPKMIERGAKMDKFLKNNEEIQNTKTRIDELKKELANAVE